MRFGKVGLLVATAAVAVAAVGWQAQAWRKTAQADAKLQERIGQRLAGDPSTSANCLDPSQGPPLVLLVLGQSNAGNHGTRYGTAPHVLQVVTDRGGCFQTREPLPGATGLGGSIWSRLPSQLQAAGLTRPVVLGLLAVDATSMREWSAPHSPLAALMEATAQNLMKQGLTPDLVLWQHGETDARLGTPPVEYAQGLLALARRLRATGVQAPWMLAQSTVCKGPAATALHGELARLVAAEPGFLSGANTDSFAGTRHRRDGCHFSDAGLDAAAHLWALVIAAQVR
jgi:hypothetical protein